MNNPPCPLCLSKHTKHFFSREDKQLGERVYFQCPTCLLIYLDPKLRLNKEEEKARYDLHENDPKDQDYCSFLAQMAEPLSLIVSPGDKGLDYGCGPGPAMSVLLIGKGIEVSNYDPFYFPDSNLLEQQYDFISCTEVVEHFYNPREEFKKFSHLVKSGGFIGIMTTLYDPKKNFGDWWYQREPVHVCFYQQGTLEWIAGWQEWTIEYRKNNVTIFMT